MDRVAVLGCSGSGKSTFSRAMAEATGLPIVSLDALFWHPGWVEPTPAEFAARLRPELEEARWIIDGNFLSQGLGEERLRRADLVVLFDLPTVACLLGALSRIARGHGRVRPEMAPGCPERFDLAFLDYIRTYRRDQLPKVEEAIAAAGAGLKTVRFRSRREASAFVAMFDRPRAPLPPPRETR